MSEGLDNRQRLIDLVSRLSVSQLQFVAARLGARNDRDAATKIGLSANTVYAWPKADKAVIGEVQQLMHSEAAVVAAAYLQRHVLDAAMLKVAAMQRSDDVQADDAGRMAQAAATEILDRVLGKPRQQVEVSGDGDAFVPKMYVTVSPDMWDSDE